MRVAGIDGPPARPPTPVDTFFGFGVSIWLESLRRLGDESGTLSIFAAFMSKLRRRDRDNSSSASNVGYRADIALRALPRAAERTRSASGLHESPHAVRQSSMNIGVMYDVRNKRVTVAGLGKFGGQIAAAKWLVAQGATVLVTDATPAEKLAASVKELDGLPIEFRLGEHRLAGFHVRRPGRHVAGDSAAERVSRRARTRRACRSRPRSGCSSSAARPTIVGVTGTKGKSTTTALLGRMLATKFTTHVGGNIGRSLLLDLPNIRPDDLVVLELSSFMLEYLRESNWSPHVAVVTMLSADHVDWHGSPEAYLDAKNSCIVRHQRDERLRGAARGRSAHGGADDDHAGAGGALQHAPADRSS